MLSFDLKRRSLAGAHQSTLKVKIGPPEVTNF